MIKRAIPLLKPRSKILHQSAYYLLDHNKVQKAKAKFFGNQERTLKLKIKFILKETKYTIVQGSKDLWADSKWIFNLYKKKKMAQFTGYQKAVSWRIILDVMKFIPYSILLAIPLAQLLIPVVVWVFPNAVPSFFLFDTAEDKRIENFQVDQEDSHRILFDKLIYVLRDLSKRQQEFTQFDNFKTDFFEVIDLLNEKLNFENFTSDELLLVLKFLGGQFMTGTATINKISNLFTMTIPRGIIKFFWYIYSKISKKELQKYQDPFFVTGNFRIFKFNYFPFEYFKRQFLLIQIRRKFAIIQKQDRAFEKYGMDDIQGNEIKNFARERGLTTLSCYETLKNVVKNDWVRTTTHPKFQNYNTKLWYSVMMYHFLSKTNHDLN